MLRFAMNMKGNSKTQIPTTTSSKNTCPDSCPLKEKGCYAKYNFLGNYWERLSKGEAKGGMSYLGLVKAIKALPEGTLWRHNQAGDLVYKDGLIDEAKLNVLTWANKGKRGFTYTHHLPNIFNHSRIKKANDNGFTVNLSANDLDQADRYVRLGLPVVSLVPASSPKTFTTSAGNKVVVCPAQTTNTSCKECKLCYDKDRNYIIGFKPHGAGNKRVELISMRAVQ